MLKNTEGAYIYSMGKLEKHWLVNRGVSSESGVGDKLLCRHKVLVGEIKSELLNCGEARRAEKRKRDDDEEDGGEGEIYSR